MKTAIEREFETRKQGEMVHRIIGRLIDQLEGIKDQIDGNLPLYEHYMPQQNMIDLAIQYGKLMEMRDIQKQLEQE